jgi:hypothetical protein
MQDVAACCAVHHGVPVVADALALIVFALLLLLFGAVAFLALSSKKVRPSC